MKKATIFFVFILVCSFTLALNAADWEVLKEFDFNDDLTQIDVQSQSHGFLLADHTLWEFKDHPGNWMNKGDLPAREDPANPGEELSYSTYRMASWGDTVAVTGSKGTILISTDAGNSWIDLSDSANIKVTLEWVKGLKASQFWASGGTSSPKKGYLLKVENLSTVTRHDNEEMDYKLSQVHFTDAMHGHAIAGGTKGDYFRTEDGGVNWTKMAGMFKGGTSGRIYDLAFPSPDVGYAAGYYGYVYKTTDGGQSIWEQIETP